MEFLTNLIPVQYRLAAIGIVVALVGVGGYVWGRFDGGAIESAEWLEKKNQELVQANAKIRALEDAARATERLHSEAMSTIGTEYEGKLKNANEQRKSDLAAVLSGALRLRDPVPPSAWPGGTGQVATAAVGGDGRPAGELSATATGFLLDLASDADIVARQLAACQAVIRKDRTVLLPTAAHQ